MNSPATFDTDRFGSRPGVDTPTSIRKLGGYTSTSVTYADPSIEHLFDRSSEEIHAGQHAKPEERLLVVR